MATRLIRIENFPKKHVIENKFLLGADVNLNNSTILPIIHHDGGLAAPSTIKTNPHNASFSDYTGSNCHFMSRVHRCDVVLDFTLTKAAIETDKIRQLRIYVAPIFTAFLESLTPEDEVSTNTVEDILALTHETTDEQTYPVYTGTDLNGDHNVLGTDTPGLTTDTKIEEVNFSLDTVYNALQYYTNKAKVKKAIPYIKHYTLTRDRKLRVKIRMKNSVKAINPYTFFGIAIQVPHDNSKEQLLDGGDVTAIDHVRVNCYTRYNEWHNDFNNEY
jgi:hypothetical protein